MDRTENDKEIQQLLEEAVRSQPKNASGSDQTRIWKTGDKTFEGVGKTQIYKAAFKWPKA